MKAGVLSMLTEAQIARVKRLRGYGLTWKEIETRTGIPQASAYYAAMGRKKSKAAIERDSRRLRTTRTIQSLRATVRRLEARLGLRAEG
jgi:SOS-response transcriptional repressor LexA